MDELTIISLVTTAILGAISIFSGSKYLKFKKTLKIFVDMIEDDEISPDELQKFTKSIKELIK